MLENPDQDKQNLPLPLFYLERVPAVRRARRDGDRSLADLDGAHPVRDRDGHELPARRGGVADFLFEEFGEREERGGKKGEFFLFWFVERPRSIPSPSQSLVQASTNKQARYLHCPQGHRLVCLVLEPERALALESVARGPHKRGDGPGGIVGDERRERSHIDSLRGDCDRRSGLFRRCC